MKNQSRSSFPYILSLIILLSGTQYLNYLEDNYDNPIVYTVDPSIELPKSYACENEVKHFPIIQLSKLADSSW